MIRSQRGAAVVGLLAILALALFSGGVYYYLQNKTYAPSSTEAPAATSDTPKEVKNDADASKVDASMEKANETNLNDTRPSESDMGL